MNFKIIILTGFLRKYKNNYKSDKLSYLRIIAGYYIYKKLSLKNKVNIIIVGGKSRDNKYINYPNFTLIIKKELMDLGLKSNQIRIDNKSKSTYESLLWINKNIKSKKIIILTNYYHINRIKYFLKLPIFNKLIKRINIQSSEKILIDNSITSKKSIELLYNTVKIKKLISREKQGIRDLIKGQYKLK